MKIAILGAGVVGVTTAYELSRNPDYRIEVVDAGAGAATEASGVNASMIAPGHAYAWASPAVPKILLKSFYRNDQAFRMKFRLNAQFWRWTALFLKQCNERDAIASTKRKHALCRYSQQMLNETVARHDIQYDRVARGLLYFYRSEQSMRAGVRRSRLLADQGQQMEVLSAEEVVQLDQAYAPAQAQIAGAIYSPSDETGSSQKFVQSLVGICESRGVKFRFGANVHALRLSGKKVQSAVTADGEIDADLFVVSLGAHSPLILRKVGVSVPIYPVKGYSVTLPVSASDSPPTIGAVDEDRLVAYAPIGDAMRITATAEFCGYDASHSPKDFAPMMKAVQGLMPSAADYSRPTYRTCFRPMTPQGTPYIGFTHVENLFVNSGQGHMGWTMASGSAKIAADLIAGNAAAIDVTAFDPKL